MSIRMMSAAWDLPIPTGAKMVLLALCDHANDEGVCYPSQEGLAAKCSMSKRAVVTHLRWLEEHGLLRRERRQKTNVRQSNLYHVCLDGFVAEAQPESANSACANSACANSAPPKVQKTSSASADSAPSYKDEPSINRHIEPSEGGDGVNTAIAPPVVVDDLETGKRKTGQGDDGAIRSNPDNVATWQAYARAYRERYGVVPASNVKTRSQIAQFVRYVGAQDAPALAAFYVRHNDAWFVKCRHDVGNLLKAYQQVATDFARGEQMTGQKARQMEGTQGNFDSMRAALAARKARSEES